MFESEDIDIDVSQIAYADETSCCWVLHEDIFDHIVSKFSFLKSKTADEESVTLAGHN